MLGYDLTIRGRNADGDEVVLGSLTTGLGATAWFDELVEDKKAEFLGGNGYPTAYSVQVEHLLAKMERDPLTGRFGDVLPLDGFEGCPSDQWLLVEAWDLS